MRPGVLGLSRVGESNAQPSAGAPRPRRADASDMPARSLTTFPRPAGDVVRAESLQLLGCYLVDQRTAAQLSLDVLARRAARSEEWIASVERGECCPTPRGFAALNKGLREGGIGMAAGIDIRTAYQGLDAEPFGDMARELRTKYGLAGPAANEYAASDLGAVMPLLQETRYQDRILALTPLVLLATVLGFFVVGRPWRGRGLDFMQLDFEAVALLGVSAATFSSLVLPAIGRLLQRLSVLVRFGRVRWSYDYVSHIRRSEQAVRATGAWYVAEEGQFLVHSYRTRARSLCLEADLSERLILVFVGGLLAAIAALSAALSSSPAVASWAPWALSAVALVVLLGMFFRRQQRLAIAIPVVLDDGYGVPPESPDPESAAIGSSPS